MKTCIVCHKSFSNSDLLTIVVDPADLHKSIKPSPVCPRCYDKSGIAEMEKIDRVGNHASAFVPNDEGSLVDRDLPVDETERWVAETKNEIATLETLLATGQDQDVNAIRAKITALRLRLSARTAPAGTMDRIGRIL